MEILVLFIKQHLRHFVSVFVGILSVSGVVNLVLREVSVRSPSSGPDNSSFAYLLLISFVAFILLGILIAKFRQSYEEQKKIAHVSITLSRTKLLHKMETALWTKPIRKV